LLFRFSYWNGCREIFNFKIYFRSKAAASPAAKHKAQAAVHVVLLLFALANKKVDVIIADGQFISKR
jgi:hypothetical protein